MSYNIEVNYLFVLALRFGTVLFSNLCCSFRYSGALTTFIHTYIKIGMLPKRNGNVCATVFRKTI